MITLNYRDARPIYEQVCDGLRRLIVSGAIADGDKLPSVRALATQLAINPNTIQRLQRVGNERLLLLRARQGLLCRAHLPRAGRRAPLIA